MDPAKLHAFISQLKLVFRSCLDDFFNNSIKITYAISWLKGMAQCWYKPNLSLNEDELPDFALDWSVFQEALNTTFSEPGPATSATQKLNNLTMKDSHHLTCYNIEFNKYATCTSFSESNLKAHYYKGRVPCLKD